MCYVMVNFWYQVHWIKGHSESKAFTLSRYMSMGMFLEQIHIQISALSLENQQLIS
jgi:hypothetical protein